MKYHQISGKFVAFDLVLPEAGLWSQKVHQCQQSYSGGCPWHLIWEVTWFLAVSVCAKADVETKTLRNAMACWMRGSVVTREWDTPSLLFFSFVFLPLGFQSRNSYRKWVAKWDKVSGFWAGSQKGELQVTRKLWKVALYTLFIHS